jgi:hypothetical protein
LETKIFFQIFLKTITMKKNILIAAAMVITIASFSQTASVNSEKPVRKTVAKSLFIDVHDLPPGKVSFADVMAAHQKDLATENKYDVSFIKFWIDEQKGKVYCLSSARDSQSVVKTHAEAHGLLPSAIYKVSAGTQANIIDGKQFFIDVHIVGAGKVTVADVAAAHAKDLAVEKKYGANFINYWLDEKTGTIFCLSQAPDSSAIINTHKEAHGLLPDYILKVKQGE